MADTHDAGAFSGACAYAAAIRSSSGSSAGMRSMAPAATAELRWRSTAASRCARARSTVAVGNSCRMTQKPCPCSAWLMPSVSSGSSTSPSSAAIAPGGTHTRRFAAIELGEVNKFFFLSCVGQAPLFHFFFFILSITAMTNVECQCCRPPLLTPATAVNFPRGVRCNFPRGTSGGRRRVHVEQLCKKSNQAIPPPRPSSAAVVDSSCRLSLADRARVEFDFAIASGE